MGSVTNKNAESSYPAGENCFSLNTEEDSDSTQKTMAKIPEQMLNSFSPKAFKCFLRKKIMCQNERINHWKGGGVHDTLDLQCH